LNDHYLKLDHGTVHEAWLEDNNGAERVYDAIPLDSLVPKTAIARAVRTGGWNIESEDLTYWLKVLEQRLLVKTISGPYLALAVQAYSVAEACGGRGK
jgi:hypothetical protein